MRVPRFIEKLLLGRGNYSRTRQQPGGFEIRTPYEKQRHPNMCGEACILMMAQYYGWPIAINMKKNPRGIMDGMDSPTTGPYAEYFKQIKDEDSWPWSAQTVEEKLRKNNAPMICTGPYANVGIMGVAGHYLILKGCDDENFYTHCPWHGSNFAWPKAEFAAALEEVYVAK